MEKSFEDYYKEYYLFSKRFAYRFFRANETEREELIANTWAKACHSFRQFDGENFRGWLATIMWTLAINGYRRRKIRPDLQFINEFKEAYMAAEDPKIDFGLRDGMSDEMVKALERLPAGMREAMIYKVVYDYTQEEIADIVGIPEGTVASRLYRARRYLKRNKRLAAVAAT
jgi:RNA polymerase sigma-70 factor (ECF subfamily)